MVSLRFRGGLFFSRFVFTNTRLFSPRFLRGRGNDDAGGNHVFSRGGAFDHRLRLLTDDAGNVGR